ncbi:hypothetical protein H9Q69_009937 [Fusarium xylarioides]|nr:hypothetical protein H9Q70_009535 [Fusarium xylarioides]KAG5791023.1 hypothetical protein H9Q69_009937 [Fusarium xylarioides]
MMKKLIAKERMVEDIMDQDYTTQYSPDPVYRKVNLAYEDYHVGWICALPIELAAATAMLTEVHESLPRKAQDGNTYTLGRIGLHNTVICGLPTYGTVNAAVVASDLRRSFPSVQFTMMIGVAGAVPTKADIRLGDVVVGMRVIQYDIGKTVEGGKFQRTGSLNGPPQILSTAITKLRAERMSRPSKIATILSRKKFNRPDPSSDRLFDSTHGHSNNSGSCDYCDSSKLVERRAREDDEPQVFYGAIASGNQVMRHGITRDRIAQELDVLCFEMEAAGIMDTLPCLVIRGICDYADSHKNKEWQEYAAAAAAAYAADLLSYVQASDGVRGPRVSSQHESLVHQSFGGDARGGDACGGNAVGGLAAGGSARGGDAHGGNARGGDASGGFAQSVGSYGGEARGGNARGGAAWGGRFRTEL